MLPKRFFTLALTFTLISCNKPAPETTETLGLLENAETFVTENMTAYCEGGPAAIEARIPQDSGYVLAEIERASQSVGGFTRVDLVSASLNPVEFEDDSQFDTGHPNRLRVTTVMEGTDNNGTAIYLILGGSLNSWEIIDVELDQHAGAADQ
jgi:hypothetical protein